MNIQNFKIALVAGLVGAFLSVGVQSYAQHDMRHIGGTASAPVKQLHMIMMRSAKQDMAMKMSRGSDVDREFARMMAAHHLSGIQMADVEIRHGKSATVRAMARKIKALQTKERAQLLVHARMNH